MGNWILRCGKKDFTQNETFSQSDGEVLITKIETWTSSIWEVVTSDDNPPAFEVGEDGRVLLDWAEGTGNIERLENIENSHLFMTDWQFPDGFDPAEAERIKSGFEEDAWSFMEENDWTFHEAESYADFEQMTFEKVEDFDR